MTNMNGFQSREIRITGKPALVILTLLALVFAWKLAVTREGVPPEVERRIRGVLEAEYASTLLPEVRRGMDSGDRAQTKAAARRLLDMRESISFVSLKSRGGGRNYIVRAQIEVKGGPPPKGGRVRYFRFSHSAITGYVYNEEVWAPDYWIPFMN